jgi:hypothetical protein
MPMRRTKGTSLLILYLLSTWQEVAIAEATSIVHCARADIVPPKKKHELLLGATETVDGALIFHMNEERAKNCSAERRVAYLMRCPQQKKGKKFQRTGYYLTSYPLFGRR